MSEQQRRGISGWTHATVQSDPFLKNSVDDTGFGPGGASVCSALIPSLGFHPADKLFGWEGLQPCNSVCKRNAEERQVEKKRLLCKLEK